ncbi:MAG: polymer-forming cytoskeletal protein [Alphaproteobacteria bacterium]|nr:polymer-forming cytoskeletal protein [Alphaproteobacteria bacterium]
MAMFKKQEDNKHAEADAKPAAAIAPRRIPAVPEPGGPAGRLTVGPDIRLKSAAIEDCDTLFVEGRVEASMDSRVLQIEKSGTFVGAATIDEAEIHGNFEGDLTARDRLVIHKTGRVSGTVRYGRLTIEEGGEIAGDIAAAGSKSPVKKTNLTAVTTDTSEEPKKESAG